MDSRVPPHNIEAEQSILGSILIEKDAILKIADLVAPEDFYRDVHGMIFAAMLELYSKREPIDMLSLGNRLSEKGQLELAGGRTYLIELTSIVPTAAHVVNYAEIIRKKSTLRNLMSAASDITRLSFDEHDEIDTVLDQAQQRLFNVASGSMKNAFVPIKDVLDTAFERIDELHRERGKLRGVPTSFVDLDSLLGGLQKSDLIILAARPACGKTSFALDIGRTAAVKYKVPVGLFSLEMSKEQLVDRMICAEANVNLWQMRTGKLDDTDQHGDFARIGHALGNLAEAPVFIDDTANATIMDIRTKARRLQMEHGLGLIIIDYLQLMDSRNASKGDNRTQEVAEITRGLKALARELNVPVLALSQLSRAVELSKPAIPKLSHLRESGSIEQDADIVMFIYRKAADKNYQIEDIPLEERHIAEIHVAKHRNGPVGVVKLYFEEQRASFRNLDRRYAAMAPMMNANESAQQPQPVAAHG